MQNPKSIYPTIELDSMENNNSAWYMRKFVSENQKQTNRMYKVQTMLTSGAAIKFKQESIEKHCRKLQYNWCHVMYSIEVWDIGILNIDTILK